MYLTDGSWFQVSCMAVRVDRTVPIMVDQEEENNMEATGDTYMPRHSKYPLSTIYFHQSHFAQFPDTPKTGAPAGVQHLKHEHIGESDLNCLYVCWVGEPAHSAGKSCMTQTGEHSTKCLASFSTVLKVAMSWKIELPHTRESSGDKRGAKHKY